MCILFIAVNQHPKYPLIIAANRDEFHQRPTQSSRFWPECENLLAGRDVKAGGTWMGVTRNGRIAALTNIRDPKRQNDQAKSRGELTVNYLLGNSGYSDFAQQLQNTADDYNGYNLLYGDIKRGQLQVFNNHSLQLQTLKNGYYGLSNASLNTPWPKIERGKLALADYCETHKELNIEALFALLGDQTKAEDHLLPDTGVPSEWEKQLSSIFIQGEQYGTRTSTLLIVDQHSHVNWYERNFNASAIVENEAAYEFSLES
ncbi:NRDE family protein [Alteromonas sp. ASW11-36]|uniref:NRDE family protein n=1 Tax=Alteromonas arenosi TaxID=3055817 RepID=A0ABT7SX38_9ALTE|nr:NRDE family protein [Alteromonas sp. ASW11-36]MDM7860755.1 NRDE family protein [Alteromonas sp. ASW11-36]